MIPTFHSSSCVRHALATTALLMAFVLAPRSSAADTVVFSTDFESGVPAAFTAPGAHLAGVQGYAGLGHGSYTFGGQFLQYDVQAIQDTRLVVRGLPAHDRLDLGFLMAIIDSQMQELRSPETALWRMLMSMADHSSEAAEVLKKVNEDYELAVVAELERLAPQLPDQRRRHIAKIMRAIFDGLGQQFAAEKLDGSEMLGLESEVRAALLALILAEPSVESPPATAS